MAQTPTPVVNPFPSLHAPLHIFLSDTTNTLHPGLVKQSVEFLTDLFRPLHRNVSSTPFFYAADTKESSQAVGAMLFTLVALRETAVMQEFGFGGATMPTFLAGATAEDSSVTGLGYVTDGLGFVFMERAVGSFRTNLQPFNTYVKREPDLVYHIDALIKCVPLLVGSLLSPTSKRLLIPTTRS